MAGIVRGSVGGACINNFTFFDFAVHTPTLPNNTPSPSPPQSFHPNPAFNPPLSSPLFPPSSLHGEATANMPMMPRRAQDLPGGPGETIAGRYKVLEEAGRGNFARVVKARDLQTNETVAVKILSPEYERDAQFELEVLQAITRKDQQNCFKVCKLRSHMKVNGSTCFIFDLLGTSLKSCKQGVRDSQTKRTFLNVTKQLGRALQYLHFECRMVHTDLKPENILLDDPGARGLGDVSIVDFGSASFYSERPDSDLISTRPYRAPEVLVGGPWCYGADMWSLGCILYELYTGRMLFDVSNDAQHLQMIERRVGQVPRWLAGTADPKVRHQLFDSEGRLRPSVGRGPRMSFHEEIKDDPLFVDLLRRLLTYDPVLRLRADELCNHPFVEKAERLANETPVLSRIPPSAYTSGRIQCPGVNQQRHSLNTMLESERSGSGDSAGSGYHQRRGSAPDYREERRGSAPDYREEREREREMREKEHDRELRMMEQRFLKLKVAGQPSRHVAPPLPRGGSGMPAPSRAAYTAEESLRAINAADQAMYKGAHGGHAYMPRQPIEHVRQPMEHVRQPIEHIRQPMDHTRQPIEHRRGLLPPQHHRMY